MALQLLKRNYTMQGYEKPKILKLPQGETRWAPRRLPVDVGDVLMNVRMDDSKNRFVGEHISKYAQGLNPYGEWGQPYKINKNNIRPPIIDPKFYQALSRMPVKFDAVTAGPIVSDLYGKRVDINKVAPRTITDRVCTDAQSKASARGVDFIDRSQRDKSINLRAATLASVPYHPSMPIHQNTGVPEIELNSKAVIRPQMGIHFPFHVSDQSRDVNNMRTPMHVAVKPGYKDPYTFIQPTIGDIQGINETLSTVGVNSSVQDRYTQDMQNRDVQLDAITHLAANSGVIAPTPTVSNLTRDGYELTPKVRTSAWYNPHFYLNTDLNGYSIQNVDKTCLSNKIKTTGQANPRMRLVNITEHKYNDLKAKDSLHLGHFEPKVVKPTIQNHQEYTRTRQTQPMEYFSVNATQPSAVERQDIKNHRVAAIRREKLPVQNRSVDNRHGLEPSERVIPVGTGRFIYQRV